MRKVGPSLRHLKYKVGETWLYDWLRDPTHFRKSTRMPRFFGHVGSSGRSRTSHVRAVRTDRDAGHRQVLAEPQPGPGLDCSPRTTLLLTTATNRSNEERCCSRRAAAWPVTSIRIFPTRMATQGPDLSNVGDKFRVADSPADVRTWMYSWLKNPSLYHPRTKMPNLYLDPIVAADGTTTDPAADIAVYLLNSSTELDTARRHSQFPASQRERSGRLAERAPQNQALHQGRRTGPRTGTHSGKRRRHAGGGRSHSWRVTKGLSDENKLLYVGHKTITKYGCYALS